MPARAFESPVDVDRVPHAGSSLFRLETSRPFRGSRAWAKGAGPSWAPITIGRNPSAAKWAFAGDCWLWTRSPRTEHHQKVKDPDLTIAVHVGEAIRWTWSPLGEDQEEVAYPHLAIAIDVSSQTWLAVIRDAIAVDVLALSSLDLARVQNTIRVTVGCL